MVIHRPQTWRIEEFRIGGIIKDLKKNQWFSFEVEPKPKYLKKSLKELKPRIQTVNNGDYKYFKDPPFRELIIRAIYLNEESELSLYKDEENNLPYEIWSIGGYLLYRQSIKETKKEIYNRLERLAVEEGLRK